MEKRYWSVLNKKNLEWEKNIKQRASKKNWYKQAISEQDFYEFYAYSGLTEKDLKENPVLLYEMIEHLNYIREYYLKYLTKEITEELEHGFERIIFTGNDKQSEEVKRKIEKCIEKLNTNPQSKDFREAAGFFYNYIWDDWFGGKTWTLISLWTQRLFDFGEIAQQSPHTSLFNRIYKLIMIIDMINSLEHNTNNVLVDLPENEKEWLFFALEIAKHSPDFSDLAILSKNKKLIDFYRQNRALSEKPPSDINGLYLNSFLKFFEEFLKNNEVNAEDIGDQTISSVKNASLEKLEYFLEAAKKINKKINTENLSIGKMEKWAKFWELVGAFGILSNRNIYAHNKLFSEYRELIYRVGGNALDNFLNELGYIFYSILLDAQNERKK